MKKLQYVFIVFIFSCSNSDHIVIVDEYFSKIHNLEVDNKDYNLEVIDVNKFDINRMSKYRNVYLSPLLYKKDMDQIVNFTGNITVLGDIQELNSKSMDNIYSTLDDYEIAYKDLVAALVEQNNFQNISVLIDFENTENTKNVEILKKLKDVKNIDFLLIKKNTSRSSISKYIQSKSDCDLWIIDSKKYGFYIYDLLKENSLVLVEGLNISDINDNVKYSIDTDMDEEIVKIVRDKTNIIEFKLKKH